MGRIPPPLCHLLHLLLHPLVNQGVQAVLLFGRSNTSTTTHSERLQVVHDPFVDTRLEVLWAEGAAGSARQAVGYSGRLLLQHPVIDTFLVSVRAPA